MNAYLILLQQLTANATPPPVEYVTLMQAINTILLALVGTLTWYAYKEIRIDIKNNTLMWQATNGKLANINSEIMLIKKSVRIIAKETNVNIGDDD